MCECSYHHGVVHLDGCSGGFYAVSYMIKKCVSCIWPASPRAVWISLYYVAFYVVMTGLFALCIYSLMCTLDPYTPDYQDRLKSPGNRDNARARTAWG